MEIREAILALSQAEKIKAGVIWVSQALEISEGLTGMEREGAVQILKGILGMILQEVSLGRNVAGAVSWGDLARHLEQALVMMESGVARASVDNLTQALSQATTVGHRAMVTLREKGLL